MKKLIIVIVVHLISISSFSQTGFNYKALIRDVNGIVISNQEIDIRFTIQTLEGPVFIAAYQELHTVTTDSNGIAIVTVGEGDIIAGSFPDGFWYPNITLSTEIDIEQDGTFVDFGDTNFKKVPMAIHADNVFSGDYNDLINQPTTLPTGLAKVTDSISSTSGLPIYGWRLINEEPVNNMPIGANAISFDRSTTFAGYNTAATGRNSIALSGFATGVHSIAMHGTASGSGSISMGGTAVGYNSIAMGYGTIARSRYETVIGTLNTDYVPSTDSFFWNPGNRLFVIGNGRPSAAYPNPESDALIVLKNGTITAPSLSNELIENAGDKALITKEYGDYRFLVKGGNVVYNNVGINTSDPQSLFEVAHQNGGPTPSNLTNAFSIKNSNSDKSWQFHVNNLGALVLYRNGIYTSYFHETSGAYVTVSDRRVKKDITTLDNGTLNKVMQLNPVSYLMKDQKDTKRNLGLISQEVQELFPSITHYVEAQDILSLSYTELIPILIKALQEQQDIIDEQKEKDIIQDKSIEALVARLNLIESKSSN